MVELAEWGVVANTYTPVNSIVYLYPMYALLLYSAVSIFIPKVV
jgi:hypothetical protein